MQKSVLFFHRCELTDMYIWISKYLPRELKQIHVAYSIQEEKMLLDSGISNIYNFTDIANEFIDKVPLNKTIIVELDEMIIKNSNNRFNLNGTIQSDRGFSVLEYEEALLLAQSYYLAWKKIFLRHHVDLFYHEPCSLCFNHIAALMCKAQGGHYVYQVANYNDEGYYSYAFAESDDMLYREFEHSYIYFLENPSEIDIERCKKFITSFRKDFSVFLGDFINLKKSIFRLRVQTLKCFISYFKHRNRFDKLKNNINYWLIRQNLAKRKLKNISDYKEMKIKLIKKLPKDERYYYFSFHLEPEATVLYLGGGIYENQIKLIQNIAASIPPETYLYVKDHPHEYAYREAIDYERLLKIPNVRLIHQSIPGKILINKAIGVFTINGTAGFEALLLGKQVFCYAKNQYSFHKRVSLIEHIKQTREIVYRQKDIVYNTDDDLYPYIAALLASTHRGYVDFFCNRANIMKIDKDANGRQLAEDTVCYLDLIEKSYLRCSR